MKNYTAIERVEEKTKALATYLGIDTGDIKIHDSWLDVNGFIYYVFTDEEATRQAHKGAINDIYAMEPEFILATCGFSTAECNVEGLGNLMSNWDGAPCNILRAIVDGSCGRQVYCKTSVARYGRGQFIALDAKEHDICLNGEWFYIYRG